MSVEDNCISFEITKQNSTPERTSQLRFVRRFRIIECFLKTICLQFCEIFYTPGMMRIYAWIGITFIHESNCQLETLNSNTNLEFVRFWNHSFEVWIQDRITKTQKITQTWYWTGFWFSSWWRSSRSVVGGPPMMFSIKCFLELSLSTLKNSLQKSWYLKRKSYSNLKCVQKPSKLYLNFALTLKDCTHCQCLVGLKRKYN